jgi:hypothetical protein
MFMFMIPLPSAAKLLRRPLLMPRQGMECITAPPRFLFTRDIPPNATRAAVLVQGNTTQWSPQLLAARAGRGKLSLHSQSLPNFCRLRRILPRRVCQDAHSEHGTTVG